MKNKILLYLRMIKWHRILHAFSILKKEGIGGIKYHFYLVKDKEKGLEQNGGREYDVSPVIEMEDYPILVFEESIKPMVSIIIPVYNQFAYTYHCLKHINKYMDHIPCEVIIGDDCSFDKTTELEKIVKGAKIIHNKVNCQFVKNCNRMGDDAKGKYLLFLNNDTQVQHGWLSALMEIMESDRSVGLSGSKLVYPNGLLQEAGGIVWRDATVLQFGNNRRPGESEVNIRRETDYISGASMIIRKELWNEIGGFDERFSPAYYEDVDLAFEVRERGYKVVYQPESEVIHFEGISEKMDEDTEARINENREKFFMKWKKTLESRHYESKQYMEIVRTIKADGPPVN